MQLHLGTRVIVNSKVCKFNSAAVWQWGKGGREIIRMLSTHEKEDVCLNYSSLNYGRTDRREQKLESFQGKNLENSV